jgi:hypothetical protein
MTKVNKIQNGVNNNRKTVKKVNVQTWTAKDLSNNFKSILLDKSFQRHGIWTPGSQSRFLWSFFTEIALSPILLVDLVTSQKLAQTKGDDADVEYFTDKLATKSNLFVSIDGNNRTTAICKFRANKIAIHTTHLTKFDGKIPELEDSTGVTHQLTKDKTFYKDLPKQLQKDFDDGEVYTFILTVSEKIAMHNMFIAVNDGVPVSKQDIRNSIPGKFSDYIRAAASGRFRGFLSHAYDTKALNARRGDQFLAMCLAISNRWDGLSNGLQKELDKLYYTWNYNVDSVERAEACIQELEQLIGANITDTGNTKLSDGKTRYNESYLSNMYIFVDRILYSNYKINDYNLMVKWWMDFENSLRLVDGDTKFGYEALSGTHPGKNLKNRLTFMVEEFNMQKKELLKKKIISKVTQSKRRTYTIPERAVKYEKQFGNCAICSKTLGVDAITNTTDYQMDHVISRYNNGTNDLANMALVHTKCNASKGAKNSTALPVAKAA